MRAVVRRVEDDGVVDDVEVVQRLEQLTDVAIVFDHAIGVFVVRHPALTAHRRAHMRVGMHARRVHPDKERLVGLHLPLDEVDGGICCLVVDCFHPLFGQRAGVLYDLFADFAKARIDRRIVDIAGLASENAARTELCFERRVLRIVGVFGVLFGIKVIQVAEELVEAVYRRQIFITVAKTVLAELARRIAERFERFGDGDVLGCNPTVAPGMPTLDRPVRMTDCPVINDDRPAVQLCSA